MKKSSYRSPLVLPKLKAKAELLQALPELRKYFTDATDLIPAERHRGDAARRPAAPAAEDSDDEEKEAVKMVEELRRVKKERAALLQALAAARGKTAGAPAGDLQAQDIAALRTSLSEKQRVLNELRERNAELEQGIEVLSLESRDCSLLVPEEGGGAAGEIGDRLATTLAEHEAAAKEIETRTVQYQLLADRTTRDRDAAEHRMKLARELKEAAEDDLHTLSQHYYEMHAAKENAERELGVAVAQYDDSKTAWQRKIRDKRREMKAVERRFAEETAEQAQKAQQAALEAAQRTKEREAAQAQQYAAVLEENNPAILARLQEAEAIWSRLRAVAGGSSPEDIIAAWQDLRDRAQALQGLLAMTRRQEDQRREELAELQQLQASQLTENNTKNAINEHACEDADASGADGEEKKKVVDEKELLQKQQSAKRLESLCAAAELSLKGLLDRFTASQESNSEIWKTLRAQQQQQQHRKSVVSPAAGPHPHRRASVLLPRRVSAVDLAHARSADAHNHNRRGSIEIPIDPQQQQQSQQQQQRASVIYSIREGPISAIQEEQGLNTDTKYISINNILPINIASPASTSTATAPTTKKNELSSELADAVLGLAHHFDLLLPLEHSSSSAEKTNINQHHVSTPFENQTAAGPSAVEPSTRSMPSGYKRSAMAGPAWMENKPAAPAKTKPLISCLEERASRKEKENSGAETSKATRQSVVAGALSPRSQRQQAQQEVQAAERYMRRLVGATVEPKPEIDDPFALDSSDEDERPVFDRAALKHRSHKVTHPKQPRNVKSAPKSSPKPTRGSPGGGMSLALLSPQ